MKTYASSLQSIFILIVLAFWIPPFIQDVLPQKDAQEIIATCIWGINPLLSALLCFQYARKEGNNGYLPFGISMIFLPLPFLFYPLSTLPAIAFYGIVSFLAMVVGNRMRKSS